MGVHDNLEGLKASIVSERANLKQLESVLVASRNTVKSAESKLTEARRSRNYWTRERDKSRKKIKTIESKIKRFPSEVRRFVKSHPFEALESPRID